MKLSEMKERLAQRQIRLTKSLGQNFLHDANQLRRIVAAAELSRQDKVLEIGPGLGPLTELLLAHAGEVLAIEKDNRLVEVLQERFHMPLQTEQAEPGEKPAHEPVLQKREGGRSPSPQPSPPGEGEGEPFAAPQDPGSGGLSITQESTHSRLRDSNRESGSANSVLHLVHDDALDYLRREPRDWSGWKLVANLPYSVSSPMLVELACGSQSPERIVATLQLEVARRLMTGPGDKNYGVLTLLIQLDYQPRTSFKIPATCFFPEPEVASACVVLVRRNAPLIEPALREAFVQIVKRSFSQRRKMMLKLLKQDWPEPALAAAFEQLQLSPQTRAETVSLEQFAQLTLLLSRR